MKLPGHRIAPSLGKAALKTHALQTLARRLLTRPRARSVWSASDLSALSARRGAASGSGSQCTSKLISKGRRQQVGRDAIRLQKGISSGSGFAGARESRADWPGPLPSDGRGRIVLRRSGYPTALEAARDGSGCSLSRRTGEGQGEGRFVRNTPRVRHLFCTNPSSVAGRRHFIEGIGHGFPWL